MFPDELTRLAMRRAFLGRGLQGLGLAALFHLLQRDSAYAAEDPMHVNDLHATMLSLLGIDHERLTFRALERDFRLTDVGGRVVREILT